MRPVAEFFSDEIDTNEIGGRQGRVHYRLDLADPYAMLVLGRVLSDGARKHSPDNWRKIDWRTHVNHAIGHLYAALAEDRGDDHLGNALARVMMAVAQAPEATE